MDITELINSVLGEDVELVEEAQDKIKTAIDGRVTQLVEERSQLIREELDGAHTTALETLLEKHDKDANAKLDLLREELDRKHYDKAKAMFDKLDGAYATRLKSVKDHYEDGLLKEQKAFGDKLTADIDKFLVEEVLNELVPTDVLEEVAKTRHSQQIFEEVKDLLGANEALKDDAIRAAVADGGETINEQKEQIKFLTESKRQLEVGSFLTESVKDLPKAKAAYVTEQLADKDLDFAQRNLSFVVSEFERRDDEDRTALLAEQSNETPNNDRLINESTEEPQKSGNNTAMASWVDMVKNPST